MHVDKHAIIKAGNINQNDKLFIRGNAISGTPIYKGINQFLKPEIKTGIKKKKDYNNCMSSSYYIKTMIINYKIIS